MGVKDSIRVGVERGFEFEVQGEVKTRIGAGRGLRWYIMMKR